jgi:L-alanine-DL-glutamate epimerase-like enolase superfamily enzyme
MDSPAGVLDQVDQKIAQGCRVLKMKIGALPFERECALLASIRARYLPAEVALRLDANGAFAAAEALDRVQALARFDIAFLEQPIRAGQPQVMADLCARSPIPIALDEELIAVAEPAARRQLLETIRPQHVILKPALLGGLAACEAWILETERIGSQWWINSLLESNVGLNAICQWTSQIDPARIHGLGTGQLFVNNVPSPLRLEACGLRLDPSGAWDFRSIAAG